MLHLTRNPPDVAAPHRLRRRLVLAPLALAASLLPGQTPTPPAPTKPLTYEVVSIRPNKSGTYNVRFNMTPDGIRLENISLANMVMNAYGSMSSTDDQLIGLPAWARESHYDVEAKVSEEDLGAYKNLNEEAKKEMMQALLADRFQLKAHIEIREAPIYALVVAKGGLKIKPAAAGDTYENGMKFNGKAAGPGSMQIDFKGHVEHAEVQGVSFDRFASNLTHQVHREVVDQTGLTGKYDFKLDWTPEDMTDEKDAAPGIFTALEEQLGLKLEPEKGPVDFVIIDHVEPPSEN
jgi:uncharacterized protein (TIGR03435 family)